MQFSLGIFNIISQMSHIVQPNLQTIGIYNPATSTITEYFSSFIREKNGWVVEVKPNTFTFQYYFPQKQYDMKKLTINFEERKSSYKIIIMSKLEAQVIAYGEPRLSKIIDNFNKKQVHENNLYLFQKPDLFEVRSFIQKDSIQDFNEEQLRSYCKNLFENTNSQYILSLSRLYQIAGDEEFSTAGEKQICELLNLYKTFVTQQIAKRNNKTNTEAKFKINNMKGINPTVSREESKLTQQQINRLNFYLRKIKGEKNQSSKDIKDLAEPAKPLAHKILMMKQSVDTNWKAPESSYGNLERVQAEYITLSSLNDTVTQMIEKQRRQSKSCKLNDKVVDKADKLNRNILVRKNYKRKDKCTKCVNNTINPECQCYVRLKSYEAEIAIVSCIRNVMAESVASYFLQIVGPEHSKISKLYSKFYPKCLSNEKIKPNDMLSFINRLFEALKLFDGLNILHRDLKPDNIMIDSKKIPKVIDFGSAWILNRTFLKETEIQLNSKLYTTRKYNLYYDEIAFAYRQKMSQEEFEQHPLYDVYAFGVIIRQIFLSSYSTQLGMVVRANINWLTSNCENYDPNCRPNIEEIENFLNFMLKFWSLKLNAENK